MVYELYSVKDGEKTLEEQTGDERPFELITGFGIALDAFEEQLMGVAKGEKFDFTLQPSQAFGDYEPAGYRWATRPPTVSCGPWAGQGRTWHSMPD